MTWRGQTGEREFKGKSAHRRRVNLFKIAKSIMPGEFGAPARPVVPGSGDVVSHYCDFENWTADLGTGIFKLGTLARIQHGLGDGGDCGLLTLIRCYDRNDRHHVLDLFEVASLDASSFCFSTTILHVDGQHRPVMCIGESSNFSDEGTGLIAGVFLFPRFALNGGRGHGIQ